MLTSSLADLEDDFALLSHHFKIHGFKPAQLIFTDSCCSHRVLFTRIAAESAQECSNLAVQPRASESYPVINFPVDKNPHYIKAGSPIHFWQFACNSLHDGAAKVEGSAKAVLGLDLEWNPGFVRGSSGIPATIQLSSQDGFSVLFHLKWDRMKEKPTIPAPLRNLLLDPNINFVGVNIKGDLTRLSKHYDIEIPRSRAIELAPLASQRKLPISLRSLQGLCQELLARELPKPQNLRLSNWEVPQLSLDQIRYGCLDAYASILLYAFITVNGDPGFDVAPSTLKVGVPVLLYSKGKMDVVAYGLVQDPEPFTNTKGLVSISKKGELVVKSKKTNRHFIKITAVLVPAYQQEFPKAAIKNRNILVSANELDVGDIVLWDVNFLRLPKHCPQIHHQHLNQEESLVLSTPSDEEQFFSPETVITEENTCVLNGGNFEIVEEDVEEEVDENQALDENMNIDGKMALIGIFCLRLGQSWHEWLIVEVLTFPESPAVAQNSGPDGAKVYVLLDVFHAMNRIGKLLKKIMVLFEPLCRVSAMHYFWCIWTISR